MATLLISILTAAGILAADRHEGNSILQDLLGKGVPISDGSSVRLTPPAIRDGLDASGQESVLKKIADDRHPLDELMRRTVVAPFQLKIESVAMPDGAPPVFRVDLWFIAFGDWESIRSKDLGDAFLNFSGRRDAKPASGRNGAIAPHMLSRRGIQVASGSGQEESFRAAALSLVDRVQIRATYHVCVTRARESVIAATRIDPRFNDDAEFPNQWQSIHRDPEIPDTISFGAPQIYASNGSYGKITRLLGHENAMLVEWHAVFEEPTAWFQGTNLLRSKLPMLIQEELRSFRGRLARSKR